MRWRSRESTLRRYGETRPYRPRVGVDKCPVFVDNHALVCITGFAPKALRISIPPRTLGVWPQLLTTVPARPDGKAVGGEGRMTRGRLCPVARFHRACAVERGQRDPTPPLGRAWAAYSDS